MDGVARQSSARGGSRSGCELCGAWVAGKFVRSTEYLGGPWGLLGASQWNNRAILELAALTGVWGVSFVVCAVNVALAFAIVGIPRSTRVQIVRALATGATLMCGSLAYVWLHDVPTGRSLRVAGMQPGVVHDDTERFEEGLRASRALPRGGFDLVVWGQSSVGAVGAEPRSIARLVDTATALDAPLLINIDTRRDEGAYSSRRSSSRTKSWRDTTRSASFRSANTYPCDASSVGCRGSATPLRRIGDEANSSRS